MFKPHHIALIALLTATSVIALAQETSVQQAIRFAAEAAPANVTDNASYMSFDGKQFQTIKQGSNNFTCLVVSNPKGRYEPSCFNEQAMGSVFPAYEMEMALLYQGVPPEQAWQQISKAHEDGKLPDAEHGSLVYMMSPNNKMFNADSGQLEPGVVHQMYYFPRLSAETFSLTTEHVRLCPCFPHLSALIVEIVE